MVVAAAGLGFAAFGVVIPGFLAVSESIRADLHITSGQSAFVVGAAWGVGDITSLGAGWLADRYGARRLVLAGGLMCGTGFAALAFADSFWMVVFAYSGLAAVGRGLGIFPTLMTVVNQWFIRRKALAISIVNTSFAAGAAALLPAMSWSATLVDWRVSVFASGALVCLLTLPAVAIIRSRPEDIGLQPYGAEPDADSRRLVSPNRIEAGETSGGTATKYSGDKYSGNEFSVRQALVTMSFWMLAIGAVLRTITSDVLIINQIPLLIWKGVPEGRSAYYLSLTYLAMIPFRFGMGIAASLLPPRLLLGGGMVVAMLCTAAVLIFSGERVAWFLILSSAIGQGVSALAWLAVGEYFGRRSFGTLVGMMTVCYGISGLIVPAAAGSVFDRFDSFVPVLLVIGPLQFIAASTLFMAKRPAVSPA